MRVYRVEATRFRIEGLDLRVFKLRGKTLMCRFRGWAFDICEHTELPSHFPVSGILQHMHVEGW